MSRFPCRNFALVTSNHCYTSKSIYELTQPCGAAVASPRAAGFLLRKGMVWIWSLSSAFASCKPSQAQAELYSETGTQKIPNFIIFWLERTKRFVTTSTQCLFFLPALSGRARSWESFTVAFNSHPVATVQVLFASNQGDMVCVFSQDKTDLSASPLHYVTF